MYFYVVDENDYLAFIIAEKQEEAVDAIFSRMSCEYANKCVLIPEVEFLAKYKDNLPSCVMEELHSPDFFLFAECHK